MKKHLLLLTVLPMLLLTGCGDTTEEEKIQDKVVDEGLELIKGLGEMVQDGASNEDIGKEALNKMAEGVVNIGEEVPDGTMEKIGENIKTEMAKMQEELPKTIELLKVYKKCLSSADSKSDAVTCYEKTDKLAKKMGIEEDEDEDEDDFDAEDEFGEWTAEDKKKTLSELDMGLSFMEAMMGKK